MDSRVFHTMEILQANIITLHGNRPKNLEMDTIPMPIYIYIVHSYCKKEKRVTYPFQWPRTCKKSLTNPMLSRNEFRHPLFRAQGMKSRRRFSGRRQQPFFNQMVRDNLIAALRNRSSNDWPATVITLIYSYEIRPFNSAPARDEVVSPLKDFLLGNFSSYDVCLH